MRDSAAPASTLTPAPHASAIDEVLRAFATDAKSGLSPAEAERRLAQYGPNSLPEQKRRTILEAFIEQFANFLIILLLAAAGLSAAIGEYLDAGAIAAIVLLSAVLGVAQEWRAEKAILALKAMMAPTAHVVREKHVEEVPTATLVPGDLVLLEAGQHVPADLRLAETGELKLNESSLTGESTQIDKNAGAVVDAETPVADRLNSAFAGTVVTYGRGAGIVVATGLATEVGRIATLVSEAKEEATPLQKRMAQLGRVLGIASIVICALIFGVGTLHGVDVVDMFMTAVSLAVAAVPEGLPAVVTVTLALGMQRMARRHSLIRKMAAVETLGSATIIATDKTGTLTKGEMTAVSLFLADGEPPFDVTGAGYAPDGQFRRGDDAVDPLADAHLRLLLTASALCNDAHLQREGDRWQVVGDTTEGALLVMALKAGLDRATLEADYPRRSEIPFSSERSRMTTVHPSEGDLVAYVKGGVDFVLPLCTQRQAGTDVVALSDADRGAILAANQSLASNGLRVLLIALREMAELPDHEKIEEQLVFLGLVGMRDPPRPEVRDAVELCYRAGITPVMITGDHRDTALAIARDLQIARNGDTAMTGPELDRLSDDELKETVQRVHVYARTSPEQKTRITTALRDLGHIVAVTGDGVNDAPALRRADIGVAMGITGTDVAKEASDMVITDDNFASIVAAVEEGRKIYDNIRNFIIYLLAANLGEILVIFAGVMGGLPVPLLPIQILWVNLVTDSFPALALSMEPADPDIMTRQPRPPQEPLLNRALSIALALRGVLEAALVLAVYLVWLKALDEGEDMARTMAFATIVVAELAKAHASRSLYRTVLDLGLFKNLYLVGATVLSLGLLLIVMYAPPLQEAFKVEVLGLWEWLVVAGMGTVPLVVIDALKKVPALQVVAGSAPAAPAR